jgi:hypothetical protein
MAAKNARMIESASPLYPAKNSPPSAVIHGDDAFVPDENAIPHTRGIVEYEAAQHTEERPGDAPANPLSETEPHGMYWHRDNGRLVLRAHQWFIADVAKTAEAVLATAVSECNDQETRDLIREMTDSLRSYVECRRAINPMAGDRKLKGEADDACYQLAQAAKYFIDATQAAQRCIENGYNLDGNKRIESLKERASVAMREGYMIAQAVIMAAPTPPKFDTMLASKRVVEYSCRKLTEWFAARREHEGNRDSHRAQGAAIDLERFLKR